MSATYKQPGFLSLAAAALLALGCRVTVDEERADPPAQPPAALTAVAQPTGAVAGPLEADPARAELRRLIIENEALRQGVIDQLDGFRDSYVERYGALVDKEIDAQKAKIAANERRMAELRKQLGVGPGKR